jgi:hypothetical protein
VARDGQLSAENLSLEVGDDVARRAWLDGPSLSL